MWSTVWSTRSRCDSKGSWATAVGLTQRNGSVRGTQSDRSSACAKTPANTAVHVARLVFQIQIVSDVPVLDANVDVRIGLFGQIEHDPTIARRERYTVLAELIDRSTDDAVRCRGIDRALMAVDFDLAVARASAEMAVRTFAGHFGICSRDVDIAVDVVDRDRSVIRSSTDGSLETLETDLAIRRTQRDRCVVWDEEFDVGDCMSRTSSRDLNLDLENVGGFRILESDRVEEFCGEIGTIGTDALVDSDLDVVAVLADDARLSVGVVDLDRAAGRRGNDESLFVRGTLAPLHSGEQAPQETAEAGAGRG